MLFSSNRPEGYPGQGDVYIKDEIKNINKFILKIQKPIKNSPFRLSKNKVKVVASAISEFAEDIHNDIGIWRSFEEFNKKHLKYPR